MASALPDGAETYLSPGPIERLLVNHIERDWIGSGPATTRDESEADPVGATGTVERRV